MPSNILNADTGFPSFTEDMTNDQKIDKVMNYLYMLLEQLRYTLANLGVDNFNDAEIDELAAIITDPVYVRLEDEMGNLTSLQVTVNGLTSRVQNTEGDITVLQQTATSLSTRVQNNEGKISQVTQTADGLVSRVSTAEGNISTLTQTASGLSSRVSTAEGNISTLTQTANSLKSRISNAEGEVSEIWQEIDGIGLVVSDGELNTASIVAAINDSGSSVMISADKIEMTGTTTFISSSENDDGELEIDGNSLAITIDGEEDWGNHDVESDNGINFYYQTSDYAGTYLSRMCRIYTKIDGESTSTSSRYSVNIDTWGFVNAEGEAAYTALKLGAVGRMSLEANGVYISSGFGSINPEKNAFITLDAVASTRVRAYATYSQLESQSESYPSMNPSNGYCFCTDGIYYDGELLIAT